MTQPNETPVQAYVEEALAAYLATTRAPDYVAPVYRKPVPPPRIRRDFDDPNKLFAERAFEWIDIADAYTADRLGEPALGAEQIWQLYFAHYRGRYVLRKEPFPAKYLAKYKLGQMEWHDCFNRVKTYTGAKEAWSDEDRYGADPMLEPFGLMVVMAKKISKNAAVQYWRRNKAVIFLQGLGLHVGNMTIEQRRVIKLQYLAEQKYPRTYL